MTDSQHNHKILEHNRKLVEQALDERCVPALVPFIKRKMCDKYGTNWLTGRGLDFRDFHFTNGDLNWDDSQVVLKLMFDQWKAVFKKAIGSNDPVGNLVSELQGVRNDIHHRKFAAFDDDTTFRALGSMTRLLHQVGAASDAQELEQIKEKFRQEWHQRTQSAGANLRLNFRLCVP